MKFPDLLDELGDELEVGLTPDEHGSCLLLFEGETQVQIEPVDDQLLIGLVVGHIPAGKGRETLFRAALIANSNHLPGTGIFAYSAKTDQLILCEMMPLHGLTGKLLAASLELFLEKGRLWGSSIKKGTTPDPNAPLPGTG